MALTVNKTRVLPLDGAIVRPGTAGEAVSAGQSVTPDASGNWVKADADASGKYGGSGIVMAGNSGNGNTSGDFASGEAIGVCVFGPIAGIDGMDTQTRVWTSTTAGGLTQTKPSGGGVFAAPMGFPLASDVLMVLPQPFDSTY